MRISKNEYALRLAEVAALRSEDPHLHVGAVVLDGNNRILSTGYNGVSPGCKAEDKIPGFWDNRDAKSRFMLHAEMNALALIRHGEGFMIACTHSPCIACARMIVAHGIRRVIFRTLYDREPVALEILRFHEVGVIHYGGEAID